VSAQSRLRMRAKEALCTDKHNTENLSYMLEFSAPLIIMLLHLLKDTLNVVVCVGCPNFIQLRIYFTNITDSESHLL
jgi:hypothetical protein